MDQAVNVVLEAENAPKLASLVTLPVTRSAAFRIVLLAALQSWEKGLAVLIFFTILNLAESKFIMPKLIGQQMHLHAAVIIIVLLIGNQFFGILGMFLAAPVAAIIKVLINCYVIQPRVCKLTRGRIQRAEKETTD